MKIILTDNNKHKMKLTDEQINTIISKLNSASPQGIICPVCGNKRWTINNIVVESREFQHGDFILGGKSALVPFVNMTCEQCAHTLFFNAIQMGVINEE